MSTLCRNPSRTCAYRQGLICKPMERFGSLYTCETEKQTTVSLSPLKAKVVLERLPSRKQIDFLDFKQLLMT